MKSHQGLKRHLLKDSWQERAEPRHTRISLIADKHPCSYLNLLQNVETFSTLWQWAGSPSGQHPTSSGVRANRLTARLAAPHCSCVLEGRKSSSTWLLCRGSPGFLLCLALLICVHKWLSGPHQLLPANLQRTKESHSFFSPSFINTQVHCWPHCCRKEQMGTGCF